MGDVTADAARAAESVVRAWGTGHRSSHGDGWLAFVHQSVLTTSAERDRAVDLVSTQFLSEASRLTRLLLRSGDRLLARTEAGLLLTLRDGPRRITELAESEALAQPTVTQLVVRLQGRGYVSRKASKTDGRVVMVDITPAGEAALGATQAGYRAVMRELLGALDDDQVIALASATETLGQLVETAQRPRTTA